MPWLGYIKHHSVRLLIIEGVVPDEQVNPRVSVLDIVMLTVAG